MAMTQTQKTDAYQFFIVAFGAVTGVEYMNQLNDAYGAGMTTKQIVNVYTTKPQFTSQYPTFLTNEQFAQKLIANVVGSSASAEAKAGAEADVIASLNAGWTRGDVIFQIFSNLAAKPHDDAEWGNTAKMFANKVAVAQYLTEVKLVSETDMAKLQAPLGNVTADSDVSSPAAIDKLVNGGNNAGNELTLGADHIVATQEGQTFTASLKQAGTLGNVSNTLESGDTIIAKGTGNVLKADLTLTTSGGIPFGPAISATTENIQKVVLRAQTGPTDFGVAAHGNNSHIDAENMKGVKEWWTDNSRATIQIEDVRTRPEDTTIGMRDTDPEVGFRVYFDPEQLKANGTVKNSALTLTLDKISAPGDLSNNVFNGVKFTLGGKSITLQSDAIGAATTHAELLAALEAAAKDNADLAGVSFKLNADNTITLTDAAGKAFGTGSWLTPTGDIPAAGDFKWNQKVGEPERGQDLITTQVELDNVGRTSSGGNLDIGSLGNGGVEKFNVAVDRDSWLSSMKSQDHLGKNDGLNAGAQHQFLQEVVLTNKGANGNLKVGNIVDNRLDGRLEEGLTDVRVVDGSAFKGDLNLGINLTAAGANGSVARYLDKSIKPVEFNYTGGQGNDLLNINVAAAVANHKNFVMNINTGVGDDRVVLTNGGRLNTTSVDGGTGNNTIVMNASVGMKADGSDTFKSFKNFQNYEVEGGDHNFTGLNGVQSVIVATDGGDTALRNLPTDLSTVVVTGKNQTAGVGNANAAQDFGTLDFQAAKSEKLTVKLDNTALVDGKLTVDVLKVSDDPANLTTNKSAVRTLDVVSTGVAGAQSANVIASIDAEAVSSFNFSGDHALTARLDKAANVSGNVTGITDLKVDGSAMTADLSLTVAADLATKVDGNKTASYKGGQGAKDTLTFTNGVFTTAKTSVSGFETVAFDGGQFNAVNTTGVTLYKSTGEALNLIGLQATEKVEVGSYNKVSHTGVNGGGEQVFKTNTVGAGSALDLTIKHAAAATQNVSIDGFKTVNLKLNVVADSPDNNAKAFDLDLSKVKVNVGANDSVTTETLADALTAIDANAQIIDKIAAKAAAINSATDKIVVTGGVGAASGAGTTDDSLNLNTLSSSIKTLDVSGYKGVVTATIGAPLSNGGVAGSTLVTTGNTEVKVGAYGIDITDTAHGGIATVTTFTFTTDAVKLNGVAQEWKIDGFQGKLDHSGVPNSGAALGDVTVLDLSALGIRGQQDLHIVDSNPGEVTITSNSNHNFKIVLTGVYADQLSQADNFKFAV